MKKIIALLIVSVFLLTGCQKKIEIKEEYKNDKPISASSIPAVNEIVDIKEGVEVESEVIGDKYEIRTIEERPTIVEVTLSYDPIKVDASTMEVDMGQFFSDPEKANKASYEIKDEVITVKYEDSSFDVLYVVIYPRYEVVSDPVIDLYTGYEIEDIVSAPDIEIEHSLDEENSKLNVKLTKGLWSEELSIDVTLVDSNPFPAHYHCQDDEWEDVFYDMTVYEDGTMYDPKYNQKGHWFEDGTYYWEGYPTFKIDNVGEDEMIIWYGLRLNGNRQYEYCVRTDR